MQKFFAKSPPRTRDELIAEVRSRPHLDHVRIKPLVDAPKLPGDPMPREKKKSLVLDAETLTVLRDYREHVRKHGLVTHSPGPRRNRRTAEPPPHWTEVLSLDWMVAGPKHSGFDRGRWSTLQRLRNQHGPAVLDQLDELLDAEGTR